MIEIKTQYPYENEGLIKHYAEDEQGNKYYITQKVTGREYQEAIDIYPCRYTYEATTKRIENIGGDEDGIDE